MRDFTKLFIAVFILLLHTSVIWGQIWSNPITGTNPNTTDPYTAGQTVVANLTVSGIKRGAGIAGTAANDRFNANGWDTPSMDASGGYFQFTLTPNAGYAINFTSFVYVSQTSGTGPTLFAVRSSVDGYAANLGSPLASGATVTLTAAAYQNITSAITFRVYGWGASGSGGTFSVNSFNFNGAVVSTACTAPTTQATNITFPTVGGTSLELDWTNGNGAGRIIKMNTVNSFSLPTTGENPTANLNYAGSGTQVIFNGTGSGPITVTGLSEGTTYYFRIYEYCSPTRTYNVSAATGNGASQQTQVTTTESINTTVAAYGPFCNGTDNSIVINYTSTGTFTGTFSAELSDASGSFATPSIIGSGPSPITAIIPAGTVAGTGYRIRVVNDNPSTIGTHNGSNIIINETPTSSASITPINICVGTVGTIEGTGSTGATSYTFWTQAVGGNVITPSTIPAGSVSGNVLTVDAAQAVGDYTYYVQAENTNCVSLARQAIEASIHALPLVNLGNDTSYCAGSTFSLTLDAGNVGSTFDWNNGEASTQTFTATEDGIYTVSVTDVNGCISSDSRTIAENTLPVVALGNDTSYCTGSTFSLTLDAGNVGSTFDWNNGEASTQTFTAMEAGTYTVTVTDANGCEGTDSRTIAENTLPVVALGNDTSYCVGSAFSLILDADNAGSSFDWNNGEASTQTFNITEAGTYTVTVTDANGCVGTDSRTISENTLPVVALGNDTSYCIGSAFSLILDADNAGSTFDWNNGAASTQTFTATEDGTYTVTVTDANGCVGTDTKIITEDALPVINLGSDIATGSASQVLDAGTGFASYAWTPGNQNTQQITVTQNGTYKVTVTNADGCSASDEITVSFTASVNELESTIALQMFPNPASQVLNIRMDYQGDVQLDIISSNGQRLANRQVTAYQAGQTIEMDLGQFSSGIYFIRLTAADFNVTKTFVINR